jgi:hypothetical protein
MDALMSRKDELEALTRFVVIVGIPVGLVQAWWRYRKEQKAREYGTYNALDERYIDFQRLCLTNPIQRKEELIAFTLLFSIFERAFLMYSEQPWWVRRRQWTGWHDYLVDYCTRSNFRRAWTTSGETFDTRFQAYMAKLLEQVPEKSPPLASTPPEVNLQQHSTAPNSGLQGTETA